jgi:hypothetical protein
MRKVYGVPRLADVKGRGTKTELIDPETQLPLLRVFWSGPGHYAHRVGAKGVPEVLRINPANVRMPKDSCLGYMEDEASLMIRIGETFPLSSDKGKKSAPVPLALSKWYRAALAHRAAKSVFFLKWGCEGIFPLPKAKVNYRR